jgi:hypothetical protein
LFTPLDEKFLLAYGEALMEWSYVENRLFRWFMHLTALEDEMARAIFFSARSFLGRSDMLDAVIERATFSNYGQIARQIIEEATQKANSYAGFRNAIAHGFVISEYSEKGRREFLVQGKHPTHLQSETGITFDRLKIASENFASLANLLSWSLRLVGGTDRPDERLQQLQKCHNKLMLLPNVPDQDKPSQKQLGRQRQRQAAGRKKSHK